jgi:hypothetical protein
MVYKELLHQYAPEVDYAAQQLFDATYQNQKSSSDLLLVLLHDHKDGRGPEFKKVHNLSPYKFGPAYADYFQYTFYEFFRNYRIETKSRAKFLALLEHPDRELRDKMLVAERIHINLELLIYLKFWASDMILRQLFNLANLARGEHYVWEFEPSYKRSTFIRESSSNRSKTYVRNSLLAEDVYSTHILNFIVRPQYF